MYKIPAYGKTYNSNAPDVSFNFYFSVAIQSFLINPMKERKLPFKANFMKESFYVVLHLVTRVLLSRRKNRDELLKEDVVLLWLLI